jgi:signal transduction histidine kinase
VLRPRIRSHPRVVLGAAALLAAVMLGVFAFLLADSQASSRHEAEQRFLAQATIAAGLTKAIFSTINGPQLAVASKRFGAARIDPRSLTELAHSSDLSYAYVTNAEGRVLATSRGAALSGPARRGTRSLGITRALGGKPWFSDLVKSRRGGGYLIDEAIPFPTRFGRRVEVLGYPASHLSAFLGSYLVGALPDHTAHGLVLDGRGRIIASSVPGVMVGTLPVTPFLAILHSSPATAPVHGHYAVQTGHFKGARYVVAAPIGGSAWRVGITEPASTVYPADVGSQRWVIWTVLVAFALAALGCLYLLGRSLKGAAALRRQIHHGDEVNAELEATNSELNAFSYSVSHDLRAPLRAINGFSRIALDDDENSLSAAQQRYLGLIRTSTRVMGTLIDDLLAFSRLSHQPLTRTRVNSAEIVAEIESELLAAHRGEPIEFITGTLPSVEADPALLRQVFANLLGNAVKYTRGREPQRITVDSERQDGQLTFVVRDNGVGFDMRYAEKLFQVFQRLHRAEDYEGTGVGLAIVQRIVTRHGGRAWADSAPEHGASFYFTLGKGRP